MAGIKTDNIFFLAFAFSVTIGSVSKIHDFM
jgi:hypothetical protein